MSGPRAAVDVGTNSVRLLVVDGDGDRVLRELTITRLGQGVDATGRLHPEALERTIDAIARYAEIWRDHGVEDAVRIASTSAIRDATNRDDFFAGVRRVAGVDAEVLTGQEEAALAFAGAAGAVEVATPTAVVDLGGGSTELVVGDADGEVVGSVSLQLGCVRLTERFLHGDPPTTDELRAAEVYVHARLDEADRTLGAEGASLHEVASLIGVAGTSTTLAALHLGLDAYREEAIHGAAIPAPDLVALTGDLVARTAAERAALGPVQPGREDVLHGGAVVLAAIVTRYGLPELVVSEADGLDGLARSLAG
ncbi:Ppx/GppA phosphatase family protein [Nitriliruptor alkaliphilus]|uniref:Ppx/GppA phosphatase family protein n=1 Tax=Nitriliruptor alkaliphilus TaxID=427918 RepID=UPI0006973A31|nr:Ppx/GppA phosphatase family protein [Nitriliruptor alkaliphilus]